MYKLDCQARLKISYAFILCLGDDDYGHFCNEEGQIRRVLALNQGKLCVDVCVCVLAKEHR